MEELKLCECGCGRPAPIAKQTRTDRGFREGEPQRYIRGHSGKPRHTLDEAFAEYFVPGEPNACWDWRGPLALNGYGRVHFDNARMFAHRASYILHRGKIADSLEVCHKCDRPSCVNPEHLFADTHKENMDDMWKKGRVRVGEQRKDTRLTDDIVRDIRRMASEGIIQAKIARTFGMYSSHVALVVKRKIWKHIE